MSLTYLLSSKSGKELREKLRREFPKPIFRFKLSATVPSNGNNNKIIGAAFDYSVRNLLKYKYRKTEIKISEPIEQVATIAFKQLREKCKNNEYIEVRRTSSIVSSNAKSKIVLKRLLKTNIRSVKAQKDYLTNGILSRKYLQAMIYFAFMDVFYRSGFLYDNFDEYDSNDLDELKSLISNINFELFRANRTIHLNPSFGIATNMIHGADADLIIDENLIDIKVIKELKLERQHFNQLLGYYFLSLIGYINGDQNNLPITKISIYYARHSALWECPILLNFDQIKINKFKEWFFNYLNPDYKKRNKQSTSVRKPAGSHPSSKTPKEIQEILKKNPIQRSFLESRFGVKFIEKQSLKKRKTK